MHHHRERNRIQARKTRTRNKMILKNLQDEISALRSENMLLRERVVELEKAVRPSITSTVDIAPNVDNPAIVDDAPMADNGSIEESDASRMSDAIVHGLWKNVVDNRTEERYSSFQFPYPKGISSASVSRFTSPRDTSAWSNVAQLPTNH